MPWCPTCWSLLPTLLLSACGPWYLEEIAAPGEATLVDIRPPHELAFGPVSPAASPARVEATISAAGGGRIALESISIEPDGDGVFTLGSDPSPCVIEAGEDEVIDVCFAPDAAGSYTGRILFHVSVGANDVTLTRRLTGTGCNDPDRNGTCAAALPGGGPFPPPGDTALR